MAEPFDATVTTGESVFLPCGVSGFSEGTFMWFKNGKQVQFQWVVLYKQWNNAIDLFKCSKKKLKQTKLTCS